MLYVDNSAFIFESRTDIEKGITLLSDHIARSINNKMSEKKRRTCEDKEYVKCSETAIIKVKGGFFTFTKNFKYLGSYISYSLRDD